VNCASRLSDRRSWEAPLGRVAWLLLLASTLGCGPHKGPSSTKPEAPAKVEKLPVETELCRITLTEEAERRLGITLGAVTRENVQRRRTFGGDVVIPAGQSIVVSAPVAGTIAAPGRGPIPVPGQRVDASTPVLTLVPMLSPERDVLTPVEQMQMANAQATLMAAHMVAKGDVERNQAEVDAAQIALDRAEKLLADKAGSAMAVDDARGRLNVAQSTLHAAEQREAQLAELVHSLESGAQQGQASPLVVMSPGSGVVRNVSVSRGQSVAAGAMLFEVVNLDTVWIRVPVYVELLETILADAEARIVGLGGQSNLEPRAAHPVQAPPSADPISTTADLYFEADNPDGCLRPGQRVGVELLLRGEQEGRVIPRKAVLYDVFGGTWVYAQTGPHTFERRRVAVHYMLDDRAVLAEGPVEGTQVVLDGAAELYGTEFGTGK
jgi:RND family efflux transporter MFP subunit